MKKIVLSLLIYAVLLPLNFLNSGAALPAWNKINGPYGGKIISISEDNFSNLFIQSHYFKHFMSSDQGRSWKFIPIDSSLTFNSIAILNNSTLVATSSRKNIYLSSDHGSSWIPWDTLDKASYNIAFTGAVDPDNNIYYIDDASTLVIYNVFKKHINTVNLSAFISAQQKIFTDAQGRFYLADPVKGISRSLNHGLSWVNLGLKDCRLTTLAFSPNGSIIAGTDSNGVFISTDNANSWSHFSWGLDGRTINSISASKSDFILAATDSGLRKSSNNGYSWSPVNGEIDNLPAYDIYFTRNSYFFCCTEAGLFTAPSNAWYWSESNDGIEAVFYRSIYSPDSLNIFASTSFGLYITSDGGVSWRNTRALTGLSSMGTIRGFKNKICALSDNTKLLISTDLGSSWKTTQLSPDISMTPAIEIDSSGSIYHYFYSDKANAYLYFRSTDDGQSWQTFNLNNITKLAYLAFGKDRIYAGSENYIITSSNGGASWDTIYRKGGYIFRLALAPNGDIYVVQYNDSGNLQISKSVDSGHSWLDISKGLDKYRWEPYQLIFSRFSRLYASLTGLNHKMNGIFINPASDVWYKAGLGLPDDIPLRNFNIPLTVNNDYIYAGSPLRSIFRLPLDNSHDSLEVRVTTLDDENITSKPDTINYVVNVRKLNDIPVKGASILFIDSVGKNSYVQKSQDEGEAYFSVIIPGNASKGQRKIVFDVTADGYCNNPIVGRIIDVNVTSVDEAASDSASLRLYPNPVTDRLTIRRSSVSPAILIITDNIGREVYKSSIINGDLQLNISLSAQSPGLYFLQLIKNDGTIETARFVKY